MSAESNLSASLIFRTVIMSSHMSHPGDYEGRGGIISPTIEVGAEWVGDGREVDR